METYRLKNIILVILLLLNVFLLLLVASRGYAQHRSAQNLIDQTVLFLQNSNVSIDPELLQGQDTAFTYSYERNMEEEQAFTAALLGTLVKQQERRKPEPQEIGTKPLCHNPRCITQSELYLPPLTKLTGGKCCCAFCDKEI